MLSTVETHARTLQDNGESEEEEVDLYERLGLQPEADSKQVKTAFRCKGSISSFCVHVVHSRFRFTLVSIVRSRMMFVVYHLPTPQCSILAGSSLSSSTRTKTQATRRSFAR